MNYKYILNMLRLYLEYVRTRLEYVDVYLK
jgi:hypothetical protein